MSQEEKTTVPDALDAVEAQAQAVNDVVNAAMDDLGEKFDDAADDVADNLSRAASSVLVRKDGKFVLPLRIYGWWLTITNVVSLVGVVVVALALAALFYDGAESAAVLSGFIDAKLSLGLAIVRVFVGVFSTVFALRFGRSLRKSVRRKSANAARLYMWTLLVAVLLDYMISGFSFSTAFTMVQIALLTAFSILIDPTLMAERRDARDADNAALRDAAGKGMLGRDLTGKGYIRIDFFNLFWMFFICSILGLILEIIWHMTVVDFGHYQDRAGLLVGPFSPIYGFGAVLVTLALNRLYDKSPVITFVIAGLVGGAFEWGTAFFMKASFGITAWDYSSYSYFGVPDPVAKLTGGGTSVPFLIIWGILGIVWVKALLPIMLKGMNVIPWRLRYVVTAVCFVFMLANGLLTLGSLDCWFERSSGIQPTTAIEQFFADYCNDDFMKNRFQSMTIDTSNSTRKDAAEKADQQEVNVQEVQQEQEQMQQEKLESNPALVTSRTV